MNNYQPLDASVLNQLFIKARSFTYWQPGQEIPADTLRQLYDLTKMGPTAFNCQPGRFIFLTSEDAKNRLVPSLDAGNVRKVITAPVVVIIATDTQFYQALPEIYPHSGAEIKEQFATDAQAAAAAAFRNSSLQGAYLILAARALGLDCGPMGGFNAQQLNQEFFPDGRFQVNFICALGTGDETHLHPRPPRYDFASVCEIL